MTYVISDLHGRYDKYMAMLGKTRFSEEDTLFILGDVCDRGNSSAQIYLDLLERKNVYCIMGNHEKMLLDALPGVFSFLLNTYGYYPSLSYDVWGACGGNSTCASLIEVGVDKVLDIYNFILSFPFYRTVEVDGRRYLLVHAGISNYERTKQLGDYLPEELIWHGFDHNGIYYPMQFDKIIVGHTPTFMLSPEPVGCIFHGKGNVIDVDCGCVFESGGGRLGCLCLDSGEEFYL